MTKSSDSAGRKLQMESGLVRMHTMQSKPASNHIVSIHEYAAVSLQAHLLMESGRLHNESATQAQRRLYQNKQTKIQMAPVCSQTELHGLFG